jgi:hypothetical protein
MAVAVAGVVAGVIAVRVAIAVRRRVTGCGELRQQPTKRRRGGGDKAKRRREEERRRPGNGRPRKSRADASTRRQRYFDDVEAVSVSEVGAVENHEDSARPRQRGQRIG